MSPIQIKYAGQVELSEALERMANAGPSVAAAAVNAGLRVYETEARKSVPGTIKQEVGKYVRKGVNSIWGRAGLMRFPRKGDGQNGPHGIYLEHGTKFIRARHYIANAIARSKAFAINAAQRAAKRRLEQVANQ